MQDQVIATPVISTKSPILSIECDEAFQGLTLQEKLYSYYFTRASWEGAKICYFQKSYESPALFYILMKTLSQVKDFADLENKLKHKGFTDEEIQQLYVYIAAFLQNCGNYVSFGDTKFIPEIHLDKFDIFLHLLPGFDQKLKEIWHDIKFEIYSFHNPYYQIEMKDNNGVSGYYSSNITKAEAELVTKYLESIDISPLNTRVIKTEDNKYEVLVASAQKLPDLGPKEFQGIEVTVVYGDFSPFMKNMYIYLAQALPYVANDNQKQMILNYLQHFQTGSIETHKEASKFWIQDKSPAVETYIGFIESYLDPLKVRAEFEGFVSIVNKKESEKLNLLVEKAESLISNLPWPKDFEVENFTKPDFTSLEVLSFACSGTPVGINIPNYDDIRMNHGFKNVNLGNVYGTPKKENVLFTKPEILDSFVKYYQPSLFVIVALHELLGHGTGKLFIKDKDGKHNFDYEMEHPLTGQQIETYYQANETWHSVFGEISSGYEECRADGVALFLSTFQESLDILIPEYSPEEQKEIVYMAWYEIVLSAIKGLQYYDQQNKKWGQAHIRAAYALLQVMLRAGDDFLKIEEVKQNGKDYLLINLDKEKIWTVGRSHIGDFLMKLQIYKSTADVKEGTKFFESYTEVDEQMLKYREIAIKFKLPRKIELQHDMEIQEADSDVKYVKFEESFKGIVDSQIYHFQGSDMEQVYNLWNKHRKLFRHHQP
ncbi:hypothetical protein PPERSA_03345 [Pseudocohnilembus persalinus]|uniref:Dipeptidyl peptidase 3 n=1 Tax=Pseudocohnilembus persalinus TaxID=266149 RepID=A0A0V0R1F1_PSEPJ|nr:hypothetical protein PPERSA_03345 [Pseudocohnilembus persalinus]|eukprot:KRX08351.1 hypothetical protein PPERSA_03345 [Pseudocohnilembus persalinus]